MSSVLSPQDEMLASSQARASRLKRMRRLTFLSRKEFAKKHTFSPGTLQNWETARFGGLTEKGARLILKAFKQEGIFCSYEWLMLGVGDGPVFTKPAMKNVQNGVSSRFLPGAGVSQELKFFMQMHPGAVSIQLSDDSLEPYMSKGDWLCGVACNIARRDEILGRLCIVERKDGGVVVRYVKEITHDGLVSFVAANPFSSAQFLQEEKVLVRRVVPVLWWRR
jgi:DNA-binding transcriptional regulator YiaG